MYHFSYLSTIYAKIKFSVFFYGDILNDMPGKICHGQIPMGTKS